MNEIIARRRIKRHLAKRGDEPVVPTKRQIRLWWTILNEAVFYGQLKPPTKISLVYSSRFYGWVIAQQQRRVRLTMSPKYKSRRLLLSVLVHEMVHAWDYSQGDTYMRHGSAFMSWSNRIKRTTTLILERKLD